MNTLALAILAFCTWNAKILFISWSSFSIHDYGLPAFIIWCFPLFIYWFKRPEDHIYQPLLLALSLVLSLIGTLGSLSLLQQFAFALSLTTFYPVSWLTLPYLLGSVAWFTSSGWLFSALHFDFPGLRPLIAALSVSFLLTQKEKEGTLP